MSETKSGYKTSTLLQHSKKRKIAEKVVITVKTEENAKRLKNEGPPSDCWSWRKYGQKPIKGSPYPRGYYRCSTSKGCSAKKQVERSKTDASLFVITYTSSHNHPDVYPVSQDSDMTPQQDQDQEATMVDQESHEENESFHYSQSPYNSTTTSSQDILVQEDKNPFTHDNLGTTCDDSPGLLLDDESPLSYPQLMNFPKSELSEENDFYDELGELQLPTSSTYSFTCFSNSICFEERTLVNFS